MGIAQIKPGNNHIRGGFRNMESNGLIAETIVPFGGVIATGTTDRNTKAIKTSSDKILGVASINRLAYEMANCKDQYPIGECVDHVRRGITTILLGGNVSKGDKLEVALADGFSFQKAGTSSGTHKALEVYAEESGVTGDVIEVYVNILGGE